MHQQGKSARAIRQYLLKKGDSTAWECSCVCGPLIQLFSTLCTGVDSKLIDECLKNHLQQTRDNLGLEVALTVSIINEHISDNMMHRVLLAGRQY